MTTFDDRERAFENRYAHDEDMAFRARARQIHELGLWAAHELGRTGEEAEAYASSVLVLSIHKGGTDAIVAKLLGDFQAKGLDLSEHRIRRRMDELLAASMDRVRRE